MREKNNSYINRYTRISNIRYHLQYLIDKAVSATSCSSEDAFPSVSLSAKKLKLFINDSNSKEN